MDQLQSNLTEPPRIKRGFFKLVGLNWELVIPQMTILLGRNPEDQKSLVDVHLGQDKLISRYLREVFVLTESRKHAKIRYNFVTSYFELKCLSPNGLRLNDKLFRRHHGYQKLESKDKIQIGTVKIDFFLPFNSARKNEKRRQQREANSAKKRKKCPDEEGDKEKPPTKKKKRNPESGPPKAVTQPKPKKTGKEKPMHPNPLVFTTVSQNSQIEKEVQPPPPSTKPLQERILQEMKNRLTEGT